MPSLFLFFLIFECSPTVKGRPIVEENNLSSFQGEPGLELFPFANAIQEIQGLFLQSGQARTLIVVIRSIDENTEVGAGEEILL